MTDEILAIDPDRLWSRLREAANGCLEFQGARTPQGYGRIGVGYAHRVAWEALRGPIPDGLCVLHHCDNPPCCNVDHLFLGTHRDNAQDKEAKGRGRHSRGARNGGCKLTDDQVHSIRQRLERGERRSALAREHGVSWTTINRIAKREKWSHL